jgi:hypothetical protein
MGLVRKRTLELYLRFIIIIIIGFHFFGFRNRIFFYIARSSALRPTPNLEGQVPVFISHRNTVVRLYPQAPGSLFVFYDSQGEAGGIPTRLHTRFT